MSLERRQNLVQIAREYDALVITDDVYDQLQWRTDSQSPPTTTMMDLDTAPQPRLLVDSLVYSTFLDSFETSGIVCNMN